MTDIVNRSFIDACIDGNVKTIEHLLNRKADPSFWNNFSLKTACMKGKITVAQLLISQKTVNPSLEHNYLLRWACMKGKMDLVSLLLSLPIERGIDPSTQRNLPLRWACKGGYFDVINALLSLSIERGVNPSDQNNLIFNEFLDTLLKSSDNIELRRSTFLNFINHPNFQTSVQINKQIEDTIKVLFHDTTKKAKGSV